MTMYRQAPQIETALEAVDELADVCMTLNGLESIALALSKDGMGGTKRNHPPFLSHELLRTYLFRNS